MHQVLIRQIIYGLLLFITEVPFNCVLLYQLWKLLSSNYEYKGNFDDSFTFEVIYSVFVMRGTIIPFIRLKEPII